MLRVLDLSTGAAGPYGTALLAELGCDVIKVEPPGAGDPWRARRDEAPHDASFEYVNRHKRSLTLDLERRQGRDLLLRLAASADAIVESFEPGRLRDWRLSYRTLQRQNPDLVLVSVTPFGQTGPRSRWKATDHVLQAMGGVVFSTGWQDEFPRRLPGHTASYIAGLQAADSLLAAVYGVRAGTETAVHIDISIQEAMATHYTREISRYTFLGHTYPRSDRQREIQGFPSTVMAADGYLFIMALRAEWAALAAFLGLDDFVSDEWSAPEVRASRWAEIDPHFRASIASRPRYDWFQAAAEHGYTFAPLDDPARLPESPQLVARNFWRVATVEDGEGRREVPVPGLPFQFTAAPAGENRAPRLGEHTEEILRQDLGLTIEEVDALRSQGIV